MNRKGAWIVGDVGDGVRVVLCYPFFRVLFLYPRVFFAIVVYVCFLLAVIVPSQ